jgi:hypothetical protein
MSEQSGGPGFWQAQDGLWYGPETHPDADYRAQFGAAPGAGGYPARLTISDDNKIANWRALVHIFMAIPHLIVLSLLGIVAQVVGVISWFIILFTGKLPEGLHNMQAMYLRYTNRTVGFMLLLTEEYPPFEFDANALDQTNYPIRSDYDYQGEGRNRLTTFFRFIMLIPAMFVLYIVMIGASVVYILAWFAVLFTGKMPSGMRNFLIGTARWGNRVQAYARLLTDEYPPFSMDE